MVAVEQTNSMSEPAHNTPSPHLENDKKVIATNGDAQRDKEDSSEDEDKLVIYEEKKESSSGNRYFLT